MIVPATKCLKSHATLAAWASRSKWLIGNSERLPLCVLVSGLGGGNRNGMNIWQSVLFIFLFFQDIFISRHL